MSWQVIEGAANRKLQAGGIPRARTSWDLQVNTQDQHLEVEIDSDRALDREAVAGTIRALGEYARVKSTGPSQEIPRISFTTYRSDQPSCGSRSILKGRITSRLKEGIMSNTEDSYGSAFGGGGGGGGTGVSLALAGFGGGH